MRGRDAHRRRLGRSIRAGGGSHRGDGCNRCAAAWAARQDGDEAPRRAHVPHFTRRIDRLRWRIVAARQEAAAPLVVEADFRVVYVRTPLQLLALCVRSPSGIVVNTVVRAGSMASSQGDVVLTRRRLQHAGPCWSTVSLDTTHTVEATTSYKPPQLTKLNTCGYHPCTRRV